MTQLKDLPLVLDRVALASLGLKAETMIPAAALGPQGRPFWESIGLVYEPCPSGALLTTPRRLQRLKMGEFDPAIREAILHGCDASNAFVLVPAWLRLPPGDADLLGGVPAWSADDDGEIPELTEWDVLPSSGAADAICVFEPTVARISSVLLAALAGLLLWKIQRITTPIVCFRADVPMLTGGVLAMLWWPATIREFVALPIVAVLIVSLLACLIRLLRIKESNNRTGGSTIIKAAAKGVALSLLLLGFTWALAAQPLTPRTYSVFILDGKKPAALVPPELLTRLDKLQPAPEAQGAVIVQARYAGKVKEGLAKFDVEYLIHSGKDAELMIPLAGVQVQEGAFLDGVPVFPAPHKTGYSLPIKGTGAHHLRMSFTVRVGSVNEHFDLKFAIPRVVQSSMQMEWSTPVQGLTCPHCWGEENRTVDGRQAVREWQAQLGGENAVQLRWTNLGTLPTPKMIEVREAHFWDLRPASGALSSVLHYSVGAGTLTQIAVGLPEALHVRGVEATALTPTSAAPLLIRNWQVLGKGGQRRLMIELAQPCSGVIAVHLDLVPLLALRERKLRLPLPAPLQGKSLAGLFGYRLDADENPSAQDLAVQSISAEEFELLWKKAGGAPVVQASRAFRFQRKSAQAGLEIDLRGDSRQAQFHLQWGLDLHHADLVGSVTFRSARENLMILEFFVDPGLSLTDVAGVDVQRWHLQDSLLQVWLRQPRKETKVDLVGSRSLPYKNDPAAKRSLTLPRVHPVGVQIVQADLELRPAAGIRVEHELVRRLSAPYAPQVSMRSEVKPPEAEVLTKIEGTPQGVEIDSSIYVATDRGRLPGLMIELKDWPGQAPVLDAPGATVRRTVEPKSGKLNWAIQYPPGLPQVVVMKVRGRTDKDQQGRLAMPALHLDGARIGHAWVAWKEVELQSALKKLAGQRGVKEKILRLTSADWLRESPAWQCADAVGPLHAELPKAQPRTSVRVLTAAETVRRVGDHWLHEAALWVHAPESAELHFRFPAEVTRLSALTDQRLQTAWSPSAREYVLPLDASPRPRFVELSWHDAGAAQTPNLAPMQLDQAELPSPTRVVWMPAGRSTAAPITPTLFERLMQEAQGHALSAAALADEPARSPATVKEIAVRQQQFYACVRQAEYALAISGSLQHDVVAAAALERLSDLKRKNIALAKERRYDGQRVRAESAGRIAWFAAEAAPLGTPMLLLPASSSIDWQDESSRLAAERGTRSELILLGAVFLLVFSYFRHGLSLARRFAPEIGIGLAVAGMLAFGIGVIGLTLIGVLLLVRVTRLASSLWRHFSTQPASPSTPAPPQ